MGLPTQPVANTGGGLIDKILPFAVGQRTQLAALGILLVQLLGAFGVLSSETTTEMTKILAPLGLATLAAKIERATPDAASFKAPPAPK